MTGVTEPAWTVRLTDTHDMATSATVHGVMAARLGVRPLATIEHTFATYLREGEDVPPDDYRVDPVLAALFAHHGFSGRRLLRLNALSEGFGVVVRHDDGWTGTSEVEEIFHSVLTGRVNVAEGVAIHSRTVSGTRTMQFDRTVLGHVPHTMRAAWSGRRLRDLVSHPALDDIEIVVRGIEDFSEDHVFIEIEPLDAVPLV